MTSFQDEIIPSIKLNRPQDFNTLLNEALQRDNAAAAAAVVESNRQARRNKPFLLKGSRAKRSVVKSDENTFQQVKEALARKTDNNYPDGIRFDEENDLFRLPKPDSLLLGSPLNSYLGEATTAAPGASVSSSSTMPQQLTTTSQPSFYRNTSETIGSRLEYLTIQAERKLATLDSKIQLLQDRELRIKERESDLARQRREFQEETKRRSILLQEEREAFNEKVRDKEEALAATEQRLKAELARASRRGAECEESRQEITQLKLLLVEQQKAAQDKEERYKKMLTSRASRIAALEKKIDSLNTTLANFTCGKIDPWTTKFKGAKNSPRQLEKLKNELEPSIKSISSCSLPPLETETNNNNNIMSTTTTLSAPFEGLSRTRNTPTPTISENNKFSKLMTWNHMSEWESFISVLGSIPPANSENPSRSTIRKDGAKENVFSSDGRREVSFPSGLRRVVLPSGWVISFFANGDIKGLDPIKARTYYKFAEDNILAITLSGGVTYNYFAADGQLDCRLPDGTIQVRFPNGVMKQIDPDGREHLA